MIRNHFFILIAAAALAQAPAAAAPVYKCTHGGKVSYEDRPCAHGPSVALPPPAAGVDPEGKNTVPGNDARALLEIEKLRIAREKDAQRAGAQRQAREQRADREHQRAARAASARRKQCERLRLRQRWAAEDAARARGAKREAAQLKARRQAETLAVECPA